ncbi:MAG: hypothetical protein K6G50_12250 [bacterium]|nr:hypothetical protein [bacterium]
MFGYNEPAKIATRTPIQFRPAADQAMSSMMPEFKPCFMDGNDDYLLFGYRQTVSSDRYVFVVIEAARHAGRITAEVGINSVDKFPYYLADDELDLGAFGFRQRATAINGGKDFSYRYGNAIELNRALKDLMSKNVRPAIRAMTDDIGLRIDKSRVVWVPLYKEWEEADAASVPGSVQKYPDLPHEEAAATFIHEAISSGTFNRFLGPLRLSYNDSRFFNCHNYLMARALEFIDPPAVKGSSDENKQEAPQKMITWADILGPGPKDLPTQTKTEAPPPLPDLISIMTARQNQLQAIELSKDKEKRKMEYAFLKSFAAMEGVFRQQ